MNFFANVATGNARLPTRLGTDQPETCRRCSARTDLDELTSTRQIHRCFICANQYFVEFEDEECQAGNDN